jgi:hypothetical protein
MENLARYIIRASFSQERMTYLPEPVESLKVENESPGSSTTPKITGKKKLLTP